MRIGNRVFPYPVLNNIKYASDFKNTSDFELINTFTENSDVYRTSNSIVFKDIHFNLNDDELKSVLSICSNDELKNYIKTEKLNVV